MKIALFVFLLLSSAGCAAPPAKQEIPSAAAPAPREGQGIVFPRTADDTHNAAANALVTKGFEIKKEEPLYIEGARPRTLGVLAAETVGVWLESLGPTRTRVRIETSKPAIGFGHKDWNAPILEEMERTLGKRE